MAVQQRDRAADSPRLHVSFLGREYAGERGAETFSATSTLTNLYDGWTLDLPIGPQGMNEDLPGLNLHRWIPIKLAHADPRVDEGKPVPFVQGICTRLEHHTSAGASILRMSGYDLGKLLDSGAEPWKRFRGQSLGAVINKLLDPSWLARNRPQKENWGIQGVTGLLRDRVKKLGQPVGFGRAAAQQDVGKVYGQLMPPLQTEVGETVGDVIARFARLTGITTSTGSFVNVSADGYIQIFNPDDYKDAAPLYVFQDHNDERNFRVKHSSLILDGEDLYSEYDCYGSVIAPKQQYAQDKVTNPNAGRFSAQTALSILGPSDGLIFRRLTFADPEQYSPEFALTRASWRQRQSLFKEWTVQLTVQGHSMPGPDGKWRPIVEGNIAELNSSRLRIQGRFLIEQVTKRQNATVGTEADVVLRKRGLLGV
jgi:prophage tail gpP-like protein